MGGGGTDTLPCFPRFPAGALSGKVILSRFSRGHLCVRVCVSLVFVSSICMWFC